MDLKLGEYLNYCPSKWTRLLRKIFPQAFQRARWLLIGDLDSRIQTPLPLIDLFSVPNWKRNLFLCINKKTKWFHKESKNAAKPPLILRTRFLFKEFEDSLVIKHNKNTKMNFRGLELPTILYLDHLTIWFLNAVRVNFETQSYFKFYIFLFWTSLWDKSELRGFSAKLNYSLIPKILPLILRALALLSIRPIPKPMRLCIGVISYSHSYKRLFLVRCCVFGEFVAVAMLCFLLLFYYLLLPLPN